MSIQKEKLELLYPPYNDTEKGMKNLKGQVWQEKTEVRREKAFSG